MTLAWILVVVLGMLDALTLGCLLTDNNPIERCSVCGYRRWTHWMFKQSFFRFSVLKELLDDPPPKRGWFF